MNHSATPTERGAWASRMGFILAAAGSAIGLGNIWRFPYKTGMNGGGLFIATYLVCVAVVGLPIMIAEVLIGRMTQRSPVAAFRKLHAEHGLGQRWSVVGWLGVAAGFVILSYYSVVGGWSLYYALNAFGAAFNPPDAAEIEQLFPSLTTDPFRCLVFHAGFMVLNVGVVIGGVQSGIERWSRILMPSLFLMLIGLGAYGLTLSGGPKALDFMFGLRLEQLGPKTLLEGLGQAFFSLSLGMGALLTYGSYLPEETSLLKSAFWIATLDTMVALLGSIVVFPATFAHGIAPSDGPGLVFQSLPLAFAHMNGGSLLSIIFFALLLFAALTSSISLLEVVTSTFIDLLGWHRMKATSLTALAIFFLGIPSALSSSKGFGTAFKAFCGRGFFDLADYIASNWMLPLGGLALALCVGWGLPPALRDQEFNRQTPAMFGSPWRVMLRYVAPIAVIAVLLKSTGILALFSNS